MKMIAIFRYEAGYQLSRSWTWLVSIALLIISFLMTRDGSLAEALHDDFFVNSPFAIAKTTVAGCLVWLLASSATAGEAAARDISVNMYSLVYTSPLSRIDYAGGKLLAAFFVNALVMLSVQAGILLAIYLPGVDPALIGPFRPAAYSTAYCFIALPNVFFATAIQFSFALLAGRPMAAFMGSLVLFFMSYILGLFLLFQGRQELANVLDPIGVHFILSELSHLWTPFEKSHMLISLEGTVLTNRLVWLGVGMVVTAFAFFQFRFEHRTQSKGLVALISGILKRKRLKVDNEPRLIPGSKSGAVHPGDLQPSVASNPHGTRFQFRQFRAVAWSSFKYLATSWSGAPLLAAISCLTVLVIVDQMEINGVPLIPKTGRVLSELTAPLVADMSRWVIIPLLIVMYAGGLIWRDRDARLNDITDSMPGSAWPQVLGKLAGLLLLLVLLMFLLMLSGIVAQTMMGYHDYQPTLYIGVLFGLQLPEYALFALLSLVIHVLVNNKYIGHLVCILAYVVIALAPVFGIEHNMLIYAAGPQWTYTEMSGFGATIAPWLWFKLYWFSWAILLIILARLFWPLGKTGHILVRISTARLRLHGATIYLSIVALLLLFTTGVWVFYNTNVRNAYINRDSKIKLAANYEQRYSRYADALQPGKTATKLQVEIYPQQREVEIDGSYVLINNQGVAIDSIHVSLSQDIITVLNFSRETKLVIDDKDLGYQVYKLAKPLRSGDSMQLSFKLQVSPDGFTENGVDISVAGNGTFFNIKEWLPAIGYQHGRELTNVAERRKHRLQPKPLIASLYSYKPGVANDLTPSLEVIVGTDVDQVAIAPGVLQGVSADTSQFKNDSSIDALHTLPPVNNIGSNQRRYFLYKSDIGVGSELFFFSAKYAIHQTTWTDSSSSPRTIDIRIFHHPDHTRQLTTIVNGIKASLDYYSSQFGAYPYDQVQFVEHPGDGDGAGIHAVPGMLMYEEGFDSWNPGKSANSLDHPFAVVGHEMAHQWTVPYANVEGAPVISESLAWYYAMKMVNHAKGPKQLDLLRAFMREPHPHPPIKRGEPLLQGLDPYLSYRKGPFALYALSKYIGDEAVNGALKRLVEKYRTGNAGLATTLDLYHELQQATPDSMQYLLHDLFEVNTTWDLRTKTVNAKKLPDGRWQVTLDVDVHKKVYDITGVEKDVPMNDWVEVSVLKGDDLPGRSNALYLKRHRLKSGKQMISVIVSEKPVSAGIDPNYLLTWENRGEDHIRSVK